MNAFRTIRLFALVACTTIAALSIAAAAEAHNGGSCKGSSGSCHRSHVAPRAVLHAATSAARLAAAIARAIAARIAITAPATAALTAPRTVHLLATASPDLLRAGDLLPAADLLPASHDLQLRASDDVSAVHRVRAGLQHLLRASSDLCSDLHVHPDVQLCSDLLDALLPADLQLPHLQLQHVLVPAVLLPLVQHELLSVVRIELLSFGRWLLPIRKLPSFERQSSCHPSCDSHASMASMGRGNR